MHRPSAIRQQLVLAGLVLGLWGILVLAFAGQLVSSGRLTSGQALLSSIREWLPWALMAPLVAWLALRFPLERKRLMVSIPIHMAGSLAALVAYEALSGPRPPAGGLQSLRSGVRFPNDPIPDRPPPEGMPFPPMERRFNPDLAAGDGPLPRPMLRRPIFPTARFNLPIYWVIVSMVNALTFYRRSEANERQALELESRLSDAKLQALQMQLHPHFLFNTLNAISTLVHKDPNAADEMIANLSELLRATLDTADQEIPLQQELAFLDRYLEIQQVRFGERLRIERQIDAAALEIRVPALILQPLAENAIRHGIEPHPDPGVLTIQARREDNRLRLVVADNGAGTSKPSGSKKGIGLANTKARLQQLYGAEARLTLKSGPEAGFRVEIEIPLSTSA